MSPPRFFHPSSTRLQQLMLEKDSNLAFSADITDKKKLLALVADVAPYICVLKTHIDIIKDFDQTFICALTRLADQHGFLIMEDRKLADIGYIAAQQCSEGIYRIAQWANFITVHTIAGPGTLEALRRVVKQHPNLGILLLVQMSSKDNLLNEDYQRASLRLAEQYEDIVLGFVSQERLLLDSKWLWFSPGVSLSADQDALGQSYRTPLSVDSDILIVGRGIAQAKDPIQAAKQYRQLARKQTSC